MSDAQRTTAAAAVSRFWRDQPVRVRRVEFLPERLDDGHQLASVDTDLGSFTVDVTTGDVLTGALAAIPLGRHGTETAGDAEQIARRFAADHFPWAAALPSPSVRLENHGAGIAFHTVSWRLTRAGVELPTGLDVRVTTTGQVAGFAARRIAVAALPQWTVSHDRAAAIAEGVVPSGKIRKMSLRAGLSGGQWRPQWVVDISTRTPNGYRMSVAGASLVVIDAVDGSVVGRSTS